MIAKCPARAVVCCALSLAAFIAGAGTFLGFFDARNWNAFLACQFRIQYLAILLVVAAILSLLRWYREASLCCIFAVINLVALSGAISGSHGAGDTGPQFRILQINVNNKSSEYDRVLEYIHAVDPDFVQIEEYTPSWKDALSSKLAEHWPNKVEVVRNDPYGIAVFCRSELRRTEIIHLGGCEWPSIVCEVPFKSGSINILSAHLKGPIPEAGWYKQIEQVNDLQSRAKVIPSLLICGDFNMTPWSTNFQQLIAETKLRDSRAGYGLQSSWPSDRPIMVSKLFKLPIRLELFGINRVVSLPIDHCLVSKEFQVVHREIGPDVGSDHFPVTVDIQMAP